MLNFTYKPFSCHGKGPHKPMIVLYACLTCDHVVWLDTDILVKPTFTPEVVASVSRQDDVILLGTDVYETIQKARSNPKYIFKNYFNTGTFVVTCNGTKDLLEEWAHYGAQFKGSDQQTLQLMAAPNSLYHTRIRYDFKVFGMHSAYFTHYAGEYRKFFPKLNGTGHVKRLPCPL
jgi:lipopolysaccharide biosynthesis glycosyltransferase